MLLQRYALTLGFHDFYAEAANVFGVNIHGLVQIKVLESSDDHSGSGNSTVVDASLEVESIVGKNKNILNYFTECDDVLSEDQLEDVKKSDEISLQER